MGTLSKSLTENYESKLSTWTFTASCNDVSVTGSTFSVPLPTVTAKYVYSGKNVAYVTDFHIYPVVGSSSYSSNWSNFTYGGGDLALNPWASNASKTLSRTGGGTVLSDRTTSSFFKASNKTERTITLTYICNLISADSAIKSSDGYIYMGNDGQLRYPDYGATGSFTATTANITLNVPPTVMYDTPVYSTPHYAGLGAYSVTVTSAEAQYGGDIQTITLTVGSDSVTQNYSTATVTNQTLAITPSIAGTFTPTLEVTDSRGQVTTVNLEQITVNAYTAPSISFDLQRTNGSGIPNAEGEHGLVTASISYTDAIADLTPPTVAVRDENGNLVTSSATWYETWDATNGVSDAVNWTDYNPQSPATLYAVVSATNSSFSPNESYTVSITPTDNQGGVAQTITQTLSTGFFTIDFKAGGKEIAFGLPANDNLTSYPNGLFKCGMDAIFNDTVTINGNLTATGDTALTTGDTEIENPYYSLDTTASPGTTDGDLYAAITALGWENDVIEGGGTLNVKKTFDEILDALKVDYIVEQGASGNGYYRKWNSGTLEQWGQVTTSASSGTVSSNIQFPTSFVDTSYITMLTPSRNFGASMSVAESNSSGNTQRTASTTYITWWKSGNAHATEIWYFVIGKWK